MGRNPRPYGCQRVKEQKDVYRVYSEDGNYRIIYSVQDHLQAVIIMFVRRRKEDTYKNIPVESLSDKIKQLEKQLK